MTSADVIQELQATKPAAGADLRERVRALAAREPERHPSLLARLSLRRWTLVAVPAAAALALAAAGAIGLSRSDVQSRDAVEPTFARESATTQPGNRYKAGAAAPPAPAVGAAADSAGPGPTTGRAQRYAAELTIEVKSTDALSRATQRALTAARELGGYVVGVSYESSQTGSATMTLRVPTARVQDAIVRLSSLGTIVGQHVQIDDLQGQIDDLGRQERALGERIARLNARLAERGLAAGTRSVLEARRDEARRQLAQIRAARAQTTQEARFATIQLALRTEAGAAIPSVPSRFDRALDEAGRILAWEAIALLYVLVIVGPVALVAAAAWVVHRNNRRREDERLLAQ